MDANTKILTAICLKITNLKRSKRIQLLEYLNENTSVLNQTSFENLVKEGLDLDTVEHWESGGFAWITYYSPHYPDNLKQIIDPPLLLFYVGNIDLLSESSSKIGIVGSRNCCHQGKELASTWSRILSEHNVIVSGLAYGIDAAAHSTAKVTIAVLGNALPAIYPRGNEKLAKTIIADGGLVLSQFLPETKTFPANFLNRNRIISALSNSVIVIQAGERSGSLVTARYALEQGKDLWVVPGDIQDSRYRGSNRLIQSGAGVLLAKEDLCFVDERISFDQKQKNIQITKAQNAIIKFLKQESEREILGGELRQVANSSTFAMDILQLESLGLITQIPGDRIKLCS